MDIMVPILTGAWRGKATARTGVIGPEIGLVGPVSAYRDKVRQRVSFSTSVSAWQRVINDNNNRIERRYSRFFLQSAHCAENCLQHVRSSGQDTIVCKSRATRQALITCNMPCVTWYEGTAQPLSLTEFKLHLF